VKRRRITSLPLPLFEYPQSFLHTPLSEYSYRFSTAYQLTPLFQTEVGAGFLPSFFGILSSLSVHLSSARGFLFFPRRHFPFLQTTMEIPFFRRVDHVVSVPTFFSPVASLGPFPFFCLKNLSFLPRKLKLSLSLLSSSLMYCLTPEGFLPLPSMRETAFPLVSSLSL